jgi:Flp pilus assembly protein TadB
LGTTLLLSHIRWFRRVPLTVRLLPFNGVARHVERRQLHRSTLELVLPSVSKHAERLGRLLGVEESLSSRLRRAGWRMDASAFRMRQLGWCAAAVGLGLVIALAIRPPLIVSPLLLLGGPLLAFLVLEQQLVTATTNRQRDLFNELPVVSEQLAMLLSAGYSVGGALNRLAERNAGVTGDDLRHVTERVRLGLSTAGALREWAEHVDIPEVHRLVAVLTLSDESGDLGRLVADEAAAIRREAQRRLLETIEKRGQQVWVPVTVATLVPGVIFLIIPFLQALSLFSAG